MAISLIPKSALTPVFSVGLMAASFSSGQPRGGVFAMIEQKSAMPINVPELIFNKYHLKDITVPVTKKRMVITGSS